MKRILLLLALAVLIFGCNNEEGASVSGEKYGVNSSSARGALKSSITYTLTANDGGEITKESHHIQVIYQKVEDTSVSVPATKVTLGDNGEYTADFELPSAGAYRAVVVIYNGHIEEIVMINYDAL